MSSYYLVNRQQSTLLIKRLGVDSDQLYLQRGSQVKIRHILSPYKLSNLSSVSIILDVVLLIKVESNLPSLSRRDNVYVEAQYVKYVVQVQDYSRAVRGRYQQRDSSLSDYLKRGVSNVDFRAVRYRFDLKVSFSRVVNNVYVRATIEQLSIYIIGLSYSYYYLLFY